MNFHEMFDKFRHGIKVEATNLLRPIIEDSLAELAVGDDAPMAELAQAVSGLRDPKARTEVMHDFERAFRGAFKELVGQLVADALNAPRKASPHGRGDGEHGHGPEGANPHSYDAFSHAPPLHQ